MITAGVDLAAEPKGTALAMINWESGIAKLVELQLGVEDNVIVGLAAGADKLGIDCALGWPIEFVNFLNQHAQPESTHASFDGGMDWRRRLSFRESDRVVREITGRWPLSVSTDRLGLTAMRAAGLLNRLQLSGIPIDRSGMAKVVEVYPGATLRLWGFDTTGYRASTEARETLLRLIEVEAPWLQLTAHRDHMIASCDAFDAVIAALATRAAALGLYHVPTPEQLVKARIEGWVALPTGPISDLVR